MNLDNYITDFGEKMKLIKNTLIDNESLSMKNYFL